MKMDKEWEMVVVVELKESRKIRSIYDTDKKEAMDTWPTEALTEASQRTDVAATANDLTGTL